MAALSGCVRDRDVTDQPEDAEVELLEAVAGLVPDPADPDVGPRLEGIQDGLPALAQVEPDDVGLSSRQPEDALPRPADEERWVRPLDRLRLAVHLGDRVVPARVTEGAVREQPAKDRDGLGQPVDPDPGRS